MAYAWLDAYGRKVETKALKTEQASPVTRSVRRSDALHPAAGLTPGRLAAILRDSIDGDPELYLALAEDMEERNEHYASVLGTRKRQVAGLEITVEAAEDNQAAIDHADLVRDALKRPGIKAELIDILDATGKGFSATEIIWDTSEGQWQPKKLAWRDPRWITFDQVDRETPLLRGPEGNEPLKPYGWIWYVSKMKSGLPIRGGLARGVAWSFFFKSFTIKDWAIFCEAYGQPMRLGKWHSGATEEDKAKLLQAVSAIGVDYSAIIPEAMAIEIVQAQVSGNHELYEKRADWLDRQTSKIVLGQTATTDAIAGGHAVGKVHDEVRKDIEEADADQLASTLMQDFAEPLVSLNFGPQKKYPLIKIGRPEEIDIEKLVTNVTKLVPLGLRVSEAVMRDRIGLPDPGKEELLLTAPKAKSPKAASEAEDDETSPGSTAAYQRDQDAVDSVIERMAERGDWDSGVEAIISGLEDQIAAARTLEEVQRILAKRYRSGDFSTLATLIARAGFAARLAGEVEDELS